MKKITVILVSVLLLSLFAVPASALGEFEIPQAQTEPTIDGVYNADEWANAWHFLLDGANPPHIQTANNIADEYYPTWDFYTMWDEENFYVAVVCKGDMTPTPKKMESGMDTRDNSIRSDGIQLFINPSGDYTQTEGKDTATATYGGSYVWTDFYCEYADGVTPFTWSYEPFDGDILNAMPDVMKGYIIGGTRNGDTYTIEVKVPWKVLNGTAAGGSDQWKMTFPRKAGDKVIYDFNTMDYDGTGAQCRYGMTKDGARVNSSLDPWKQFTLVSAPAGKAKVAETAPEAAETAAAAVTDNPKTGDTVISISALLAVTLFAASVIVLKNKKSKF
jgi:LPXTG-motif cell wall-anchored protein